MAAKIILGTVQFGLEYGINNTSGIPDEKDIHAILDVAYQNGLRSIDTAEIYGKAVDCIGSFHRATGLYFEINTKFIGTDMHVVEAELQSNLSKLGIAQINTYFYHTFSKYMSNRSINEGLKKCKSEGLIRNVGLSVYSNDEFEIAINDPFIDVIQLPFNLLDNYFQRGIYFQSAKAKHKKIQVRSVFLQGLFFKKITKLPPKLVPLKPYLEKVQTIAENNALSMESMCLQYAYAQPAIDEIVIGVDNKEQLLNNIHSLSDSLAPGIRKQIDSIQVKEVPLLYPYNWL